MAKLDLKHLKKLKKELLEKQKAEKAVKQKTKIQQAHDNRDHDIFREAMSGVAPLSHNRVHHEPKKPNAKPFKSSMEEEFFIHDPLSDELEIEDIDSTEILSFCRAGVQNNVFRKLRSGRYRISDELDLHGSNLKQAKLLLVYYLQEAIQFEGCFIRIIHGKGHRSNNNKPVLKTHVNHWLNEHERVLAFHSAKPKDGGTGAVYVLLKTQK